MARNKATTQSFNIMVVGQAGRLEYEALVFAASLRENAPKFQGRLIVAEPQPGPLWDADPRISPPLHEALQGLGAEIVPFTNVHFGQNYLHGNKIEGLAALPAGEPFVFFDTDTIVIGELSDLAFDFARPSASMARTGTWPEEELYWPGYAAIWKSLYDKFGLDFASSLDLTKPDEYWERYLYFNGGWFFGADPAVFGQRFADYAVSVRDDPPAELVLQSLDPWLDQVVLPLVIHSLGGGKPRPELAGLDGDVTRHYRMLPLLYARETTAVVQAFEAICAPNKIKKHLKNHDAFKRMVYQGRGEKVRALFDQNDLPPRERQIRNMIKKHGFWMR